MQQLTKFTKQEAIALQEKRERKQRCDNWAYQAVYKLRQQLARDEMEALLFFELKPWYSEKPVLRVARTHEYREFKAWFDKLAEEKGLAAAIMELSQ